MKSRFQSVILFFCSIIIFSNTASLIFNKNSYAAEIKNYSTMSEDEKIVSYIYYKAISDCLANGEINESYVDGPISDIINNQENGSGPEVNVGLFAENFAINSSDITANSGDGILVCSNIAKAAFDFWGINSADKDVILQAFGYKKTDAYWCRGTEINTGTVVVFDGSKYESASMNPITLPDSKFTIPYSPSMYWDYSSTKGQIDNEEEIKIYCTAYDDGQVNFKSAVVDENNNQLDPFIKAQTGYMGNADVISSSIKEYIKANILKTESDYYNPGYHVEPADLNDAQRYYIYKYIFQLSSGCNAVSYGPTDELTASQDQTKTTNIKSGTTKNDGIKYPYVEIALINPEKISEKIKYSFVMESKLAADNASLKTTIGETKTCSDIANSINLDNTDSLATKILAVLNSFSNPNQSSYLNILKISGGISSIPTGVASENNDDGDGGNETTTCAIGGIGWLVCPVVNFLSTIIDSSWGILTGFLEVNSSIVSTTDTKGQPSATYQAWQIVRNVANVAFAIVFLIIIFSQVTSFGISNYGIKKMLPKLIIAAILVNLSFYICQIAVDISNILGYSIKGIFNGIVKDVTISSVLPTLGDDMTGKGMSGIAGGILATAGGIGVMYASLGTLIPVLLGGIVAVLMVLFMLIGRQAIIVLLVVLSPLAFVAYLLPNTEKLFDKWKKLLMSLLLLFPIVALVIGASSLASCILSDVFTSSATKNNFDQSLGEIAAAAVAILPLFVVPGMLKKSLDGVGNIGGTLNKLSDKWGKGLGGGYTNSGFAKYRAAKKADDKARISTGNYAGKNPFNKLHSMANKKLNSSVGLNKINGGFGSQRVLVGQGQDRKDQQDSMALFNNDDTLVAAWAETGGDIRKLEAYNSTLPPDKKLTEATKQQFKLMYNAGYQNKANSHIAAAKYMSENGKGSYAQFKKSLATAKARGASAIDLSTAQGGAIGAYRKSGRGDALSALDNDIKGLGPVTTAQSNKAWQSVDPANLHRDAIDATSNPDGRASYLDYLKDTTLDANGTQNGYENTRKALANYERMESRTQKSVESLLIDAANQQLSPILAANAATAVAEFRAARATEAAAIAAATAVGATSADKLAAATATAAASAARDKATKANAMVASGITKIREAKDYFGIR